MTLEEENDNVQAVANAIQRHDKYCSVKSKGRERSFPLPSPQVAGTMTQQRTYAMDKAADIVRTSKIGGL